MVLATCFTHVPPPPLSLSLSLSLSLHLPADIWVIYVLNLVVAIIGAIVNDNKRGEYLTTMGVSILYLVLFIPGSLFCWFLPAYYAYR